MLKRAARNIRFNREKIETSSSFVIGSQGLGNIWKKVQVMVIFSPKDFNYECHHIQLHKKSPEQNAVGFEDLYVFCSTTNRSQTEALKFSSF